MLVIDETGKKIGVMLTRDAIKFAEERGLDLVEVGETADPPVAKLMDYGKFLYQKHKQEKEARKKSAGQKPIKEMKIGVKTEEHDLQTKLRHIKEFLEKGYKTKVIVMYRGREIAHPELGKELLNRVIQEMADYGAPEYVPKQEGRNLVTLLAPHSKQQLEKIRKQKEAEAQVEPESSGASAQSAQPTPLQGQTSAPPSQTAPSSPPLMGKDKRDNDLKQ